MRGAGRSSVARRSLHLAHSLTRASPVANDAPSAISPTHVSQIRVIAAVVTRGDQLLVCQRPPHKRHGGLWEFPGGKVEPGESDEAAARRELREELAVEVHGAAEADFEIADPESPFLIAFVPVRITGEPVCHEHTALHWAIPGELARLPLAPGDRRYVEFLVRRATAERR